MKTLNLLFVTIGIAIFSLISCSKKNTFGISNDSSNTGNGVGNLIISPTPATYGNIITITSVNKNIKFSATDIEVFFSSTTSGLRYDVEKTSISVISGHPDTLRFMLPDHIPMDGYLLKVVYNKTHDTLTYNGYAVLDANLIKNAVVVNGITPKDVDISKNITITISGNNFSPYASKDTVIFLKNGVEIYRLDSPNIKVNSAGTAITFSIPPISKLISDIKTATTYEIKLKVDGKNSDQTAPQLINISNSEYPTFSYSTKQEGNNVGTFVTLLSGWNNTKQVDFSKINSTIPTKITVSNNGSFFMPKDIDADNYYIKIKQDDGNYLTAVNATTQDSVVIVKPFVIDISFSPSIGAINVIPIDYPFDIASNDSVFDITIKGANLVKNSISTVAFGISAVPALEKIPTPTITSATEIIYKKFSTLTQAGNIAISISNEANGSVKKTFIFYKPVITNIGYTTIPKGRALIPLVINGRGLVNAEIGFVTVGSTDTPFLKGISTNTQLSISAENLNTLNAGNYSVIVRANGTVSNTPNPPLFFRVTTGEASIQQVHTFQVSATSIKIAIIGTNFTNDSKVVFSNSNASVTPPENMILPNILEQHKEGNTIYLTLANMNHNGPNALLFAIKATSSIRTDTTLVLPQVFRCFKGVEMYTAENVNYSILYAHLLKPEKKTPGTRMAFFGDNTSRLNQGEQFRIEKNGGEFNPFQNLTANDYRTYNSSSSTARLGCNVYILPTLIADVPEGKYTAYYTTNSYTSSIDFYVNP